MFSQDFKEFVELLIKNKAEYFIVGGYLSGFIYTPALPGISTFGWILLLKMQQKF